MPNRLQFALEIVSLPDTVSLLGLCQGISWREGFAQAASHKHLKIMFTNLLSFAQIIADAF